MRFSLFTVAAFAATAMAGPVTKRQSATTCGSDAYTASQVSAAVSQGYNYYEEGQTVGSDKYPHEYEDYEGFTFPVSGPYYEFPITESGVYSGGEPGADRVVFNGDGDYAGAITHTGASSYDGFVGCTGTS